MTKKIISMLDFLCQIEILLQNMLKMLKVPDFSNFFFKVSQIQGLLVFLSFQVKW